MERNMSYNGYLISVNGTRIPDKYLRAETYKVTWNTNDLDSYRDANGELHRNALPHKPMKVEFETPPLMTNVQMQTLLSMLPMSDSNVERKASVTAYIPELDDYETQDCYMPDPQFTLYGTYGGTIRYNQVRFAFIGY